MPPHSSNPVVLEIPIPEPRRIAHDLFAFPLCGRLNELSTYAWGMPNPGTSAPELGFSAPAVLLSAANTEARKQASPEQALDHRTLFTTYGNLCMTLSGMDDQARHELVRQHLDSLALMPSLPTETRILRDFCTRIKHGDLNYSLDRRIRDRVLQRAAPLAFATQAIVIGQQGRLAPPDITLPSPRAKPNPNVTLPRKRTTVQ